MNKLAQFLQKFALDYVVKYLKNNKQEVIRTANAKVNLPILNEKQEAELMDAIYEVVVDVVEGIKLTRLILNMPLYIDKVIDYKGINLDHDLINDLNNIRSQYK